MKLNDLLTAPPLGWRFQEASTNYWMTGITFEQVLPKVMQHRKNMNLPAINPPFSTLADELEDWLCQHLSEEDQRRLCSPVRPVAWPLYLLPFKALATEGDKGLGDIIARTIGPVGGDAFKQWYKATIGQDCGCRDRQIHLNRTYPL